MEIFLVHFQQFYLCQGDKLNIIACSCSIMTIEFCISIILLMKYLLKFQERFSKKCISINKNFNESYVTKIRVKILILILFALRIRYL